MTSISSINLIITINCHLVLIKTGKQSLWPAPVLFTQSSLLLSFKASLFLCRSSFQGRSKVRPFLSAPVSAPSNIQHPTPPFLLSSPHLSCPSANGGQKQRTGGRKRAEVLSVRASNERLQSQRCKSRPSKCTGYNSSMFSNILRRIIPKRYLPSA